MKDSNNLIAFIITFATAFITILVYNKFGFEWAIFSTLWIIVFLINVNDKP